MQAGAGSRPIGPSRSFGAGHLLRISFDVDEASRVLCFDDTETIKKNVKEMAVLEVLHYLLNFDLENTWTEIRCDDAW